MRKYRVSRFRELIFPKELIIDKFHVLSRKRHFPAFWRVDEESIPLSKLASIQVHRGLLFSRIIIENSGGPYPIIINGLWNPKACEARDLLEMIEREMTKMPDERHVDQLVDENEDSGPSGGNPPDSPGSGGGGPEHDFPPPPPPPSESSANREPMTVVAPTPSPTVNVSRPPDSRPAASPSAEYVTHIPPESTPREISSSQPDGSFTDNTRHEIQSGRQFGETPDEDWRPPAPWEPREINNHGPVWEDGIREVDPVDFLSHSTAVAEPPVNLPRQPATEKLVNWWEQAKTQLEQMQEPEPRKRRRRKLN